MSDYEENRPSKIVMNMEKLMLNSRTAGLSVTNKTSLSSELTLARKYETKPCSSFFEKFCEEIKKELFK